MHSSRHQAEQGETRVNRAAAPARRVAVCSDGCYGCTRDCPATDTFCCVFSCRGKHRQRAHPSGGSLRGRHGRGLCRAADGVANRPRRCSCAMEGRRHRRSTHRPRATVQPDTGRTDRGHHVAICTDRCLDRQYQTARPARGGRRYSTPQSDPLSPGARARPVRAAGVVCRDRRVHRKSGSAPSGGRAAANHADRSPSG